MDISIKDTILNPVATITSGMFYKSSWNPNLDYKSNLYIDNATITHYKGYSRFNGAITNTDICVWYTGSDSSYVIDSTFRDCGAGILHDT